MKRKNYMWMGLAALLFAGCVDLNYNEETTQDEDWTYRSPLNGIQNMVSNVYAQMFSDLRDDLYLYGALRSSATDEADFATTSSYVDDFYNGSWSPANPIANTWIKSYAAIAQIHVYLENIDRIDLSDYRHSDNYQNMLQRFELFPYELRFLRAYFYFELVKTYGDVPLVTTRLTNAQANQVSRTPSKTVFKFIVDELDAIAEYLPVTYNDVPGQEVGRANRAAAMALKARTLLYAASPLFNTTNDKALWLEAAKASKLVIDKAPEWNLSLSAYAALWGNDAFLNPEIIFGLGKNADNQFERNHYPVGVENGSSGNCPTQSLVDAYEYQADGKTFAERNPDNVINITATENPYAGLDPRFALTIVKNGDRWPLNSIQQLTIESYENGFNGLPKYGATPTGYYLRKYVDGNCVTTYNDASTRRHTWIVMRLAEFYLNYAEAMFNYYGSADAQGEFGLSANEAVNVLRAREDVNMPLFEGNAGFEQRYMRERMVELAFEDHRFWDVRRWKKGAEFFSNIGVAQLRRNGNDIVLNRVTQKRVWDEKYNLFPIPLTERQKNPNLTQNPGW